MGVWDYISSLGDILIPANVSKSFHVLNAQSRTAKLVIGTSWLLLLGGVVYEALLDQEKKRGVTSGFVSSPAITLIPRLKKEEQDELPYPPSALPGARDVETPYGNIRVYEWGPEEGRKVLLVHGISTPSVALAKMARALVKRGHRVMLFGR